jgi:hypothetical protein
LIVNFDPLLLSTFLHDVAKTLEVGEVVGSDFSAQVVSCDGGNLGSVVSADVHEERQVEIFVKVFVVFSVINCDIRRMHKVSAVLDPVEFVLELPVVVAGRIGDTLLLDGLGFQETLDFLEDSHESNVVVNKVDRAMAVAVVVIPELMAFARSVELLGGLVAFDLPFERVYVVRDEIPMNLGSPLRCDIIHLGVNLNFQN